jgi:hypothetical protein
MPTEAPKDAVVNLSIREAGDSVLSDGAGGQQVAGGERYSTMVCSIFMLNMVLGTGPITLPYAFNKAGIILGTVFVAVLMSISFLTTTFVVESLTIANRLKASERNLHLQGDSQGEVREIAERFEIGAIAEALMPRRLATLPYIVLCVYAYGVLTVYVISGVASLAKELGTVGGIDAYYVVLLAFALLITPVCLLDFQKTRPLQIFIGVVRIVAVLAMVGFMLRWMFRQDFVKETSRQIPLWNMAGIPSLFGNGAFTFMVHHSIPGLVFPLQNQKSAPRAIGMAYCISFVIYIALCLLALWAFGHEQYERCPNTPSHPCDIQALFNMNFASLDENWAAKFVVMYPVLVVSVFPLVAITLRNNLKALFGKASFAQRQGFDWLNLGFTFLTVGPPFLVAFLTRDVQVVMTYIGGYFGFMLMFLVPSLLVLHGRKALTEKGYSKPQLSSPCTAMCFVYFTLSVFCIAVVFNTISLVLQHLAK